MAYCKACGEKVYGGKVFCRDCQTCEDFSLTACELEQLKDVVRSVLAETYATKPGEKVWPYPLPDGRTGGNHGFVEVKHRKPLDCEAVQIRINDKWTDDLGKGKSDAN
jgi:hypothetical protein